MNVDKIFDGFFLPPLFDAETTCIVICSIAVAAILVALHRRFRK